MDALKRCATCSRLSRECEGKGKKKILYVTTEVVKKHVRTFQTESGLKEFGALCEGFVSSLISSVFRETGFCML